MIRISNYTSNPKHTVTEARIAAVAAANGVLLNRQDLNRITGWLVEPIVSEDGVTNGADLRVTDATITTRDGKALTDAELWVHIERNLTSGEYLPEQNLDTQKAFLTAMQKMATDQVAYVKKHGYSNIDPDSHLALLQDFIFGFLHNAEGGEAVMPLTYSITACANIDGEPSSPVTFTNPRDSDAHDAYRNVKDQAVTDKFYSNALVTT